MAKRAGEPVADKAEPVSEPEQVQLPEGASPAAASAAAADPEPAKPDAVTTVISAGPVTVAATISSDSVQTKVEEKVTMTTIKTTEDLVAFSQGNLEAFVKAGQIWAAGVQDLSKSVAATAQAQMEEALATVKALAGVKSLKEAVDLQTSLARASVEKVVTESSKLTDAGIKLAEQTWAPLTARVTLAVEKYGRAA